MKAATTSLHYYLDHHPQIAMSKEKELNFFVEEKNWHKGADWYMSHFNPNVAVTGESSPNYTNHPHLANVPKRMHSVIPDVKLIYCVRDPLERIISQYIHQVAAGRESRTIDEALFDLDDNNQYIRRSKYFMQLQQYLEFYDRSRILIVDSNNLHKDARNTMNHVYRFLEVNYPFSTSRSYKISHKSNYKRRKTKIGQFCANTSLGKALERLPFTVRSYVDWFVFLPFSRKIAEPQLIPRLKQKMIDHLQEDVDQLRKFTGCQFSDWCL